MNGNQNDISELQGRGAAYLFTRRGSVWSFEAYFKPSASTTAVKFGTSVAISRTGDRVVVGAPSEPNSASGNTGAVYVFSRTSGASGAWAGEGRLAGSERFGSAFGAAVALNGDATMLAVGSPGDSRTVSTVLGSAVISLAGGGRECARGGRARGDGELDRNH